MSSEDEDFVQVDEIEASSDVEEDFVQEDEIEASEVEDDVRGGSQEHGWEEREDPRAKLQVNPADLSSTFKILIATDNHLGYMERDGVRAEDSFLAFEEILKLANSRNVDFIVLGGDLFHDNKPSRKCLHTTMTLLRQYCFGDKPCPIEFLSDQSENFPDRFATVNYQDPNFNVAIPVFSIHGNHDEPSGPGGLAALDLLSAAGLVNYFGQQENLENVEVKPLLLRKGTSFLALYGLGNIRDDRLNRTFENKKVTMYRPSENTDSWFNMLVLHQNRVAHSVKNYLPTEYLENVGSFLDICIWGHEHECRIDPTLSGKDSFFISQPGSSIATSLCEGEAVAKNVGILHVRGQEFQLEKIPLKSVRPFVMETLVLANVKKFDKLDQAGVERVITEKVHDLIAKARLKWKGANPTAKPEAFPKPLIRLKVDYTGGFTSFNPRRFGQKFVDLVANAADVIYFFRKKIPTKRQKKTDADINIDDLLPDRNEDLLVESLVHDLLTKTQLEFLPENEFVDIVSDFVHNNEKDAIQVYLNNSMVRTKAAVTKVLQSNFDDDDAVKDEILKAKEARCEEYASGHAPRTITHGTAPPKNDFGEGVKPHLKLLDAEDVDEDFEGQQVYFQDVKKAKAKAKTTKASTSASTRTKRSTATTSKKKVAAKESESEEDEEDDDMDEDDEGSSLSKSSSVKAKTSRGGRKPAAKKSAVVDDDDDALSSHTKGKGSTSSRVINSDDDDLMEIDDVAPVPKKPVGRRRAPAAPVQSANSNSRSATSSISQSLSKTGWGGLSDDDDIVEIVAPSTSKAIPKKRSAPSQSSTASSSKRVPLSQGGAKQTSILSFSSQHANPPVSADNAAPAAKPKPAAKRATRKIPF